MIYKLVALRFHDESRFTPFSFLPDITDEDIVEQNVRGVQEGKMKREVIESFPLVYLMGTYNDTDGKVKMLDEPKLLVDLTGYLPATKKEA